MRLLNIVDRDRYVARTEQLVFGLPISKVKKLVLFHAILHNQTLSIRQEVSCWGDIRTA